MQQHCDLIGLSCQEYQRGQWVILSLLQMSPLSRKKMTKKLTDHVSYFVFLLLIIILSAYSLTDRINNNSRTVVIAVEKVV